MPRQILVDPGTEVNSQEFGTFAGNHGIRITVTSIDSPWQNGRAERHGGVLCKMLEKLDARSPILSSSDLEVAIALTLQNKNAISLKGGFAPEMLVLRKQTQLPGSISSNDESTAHLMAMDETPEGIRFRERLAARKCFIEGDHGDSLRRAVLRRSCPYPGGLQRDSGLWGAQIRSRGSWQGPIRVIVQENPQTVWLSMQSKLYRLAPERIRPVTFLESRSVPMPLVSSLPGSNEQTEGVLGQGVTRTINDSTVTNTEFPQSLQQMQTCLGRSRTHPK